jgi:hypothetical protein
MAAYPSGMRGERWALSVTLGLAACVMGACGSKAMCSSSFTIDPIVTVTNAATGAPLCDASVVVRTAPPSSKVAGKALTPYARGDAGGCVYGVLDLAGTYAIDVTNQGFAPASAEADVIVRSCNDEGPSPDPQRVDVKLQPN